ncbi:transcription antitermination factor NusB [Membranicola marinus]|uniref:Transcription antitermination factor NusB n=1 Tax=Membranihabitans marinus TaxID=1227546 RepID=A0A953LED3_9BACT|nr:transcription antitermination factor NusB [Membranihabitans marinus]MBY5959834.1 transcription antitermination factor NusB [Membranihabitans marinus]
MLSRRNIRIKVMQSVYSWFQDKELSERNVVRNYKQHVATSYELLIFNTRNIIQICAMSVNDKNWRKGKHLPTENDRAFRPMLYENPVISALEANATYRDYNKDSFNQYLDATQAKKIYLEFSKTPEYLNYLDIKDPQVEDHITIVLELWKFLCSHYLYIELVYDAYPNWIDDDSLVKGFLKRLIKGIVDDEELLKQYKPDYETVEEFGQTLLEDIVEHFEDYDKQLIPFLQNWEIERIATVDRVLIKMALSEFLKFPSIPTKVTINEYVDIAKMYSTDKSKDFLNGILDALLKDLVASDVVRKTGRGLIQ